MSELIVIVALVLALLWVDKDIYNEFISSKISSIALKQGFPLTLNQPSFFITGLKAHSASCSIPVKNMYVMLQPDDLELDTTLGTILGRGLSASVSSKLYNGELTGDIQQNSDNDYSANLKLTEMSLKDHPQLAPFGISSGNLTLELNNLHFLKGAPKEGELTLAINDFNLPKETLLEQYGVPFTIPIIKDLNLSTNLSLKTSEDKQLNLVIKSLKLVSSLCDIDLDGDLKFFNNSLNNLRVSGNIKLSDELRKIVNAQLILAAVQAAGHRVNSNLTKNSDSFTFNIAGPVNKLWVSCVDKESPANTENSITTRKLKRTKLKR